MLSITRTAADHNYAEIILMIDSFKSCKRPKIKIIWIIMRMASVWPSLRWHLSNSFHNQSGLFMVKEEWSISADCKRHMQTSYIWCNYIMKSWEQFFHRHMWNNSKFSKLDSHVGMILSIPWWLEFCKEINADDSTSISCFLFVIE